MESTASEREGGPPEAATEPAAVQLGLIVSPAIDAAGAEELAADLRRALEERYPSVRWEIELVRDPLVAAPMHLTDVVEAARSRLLAEEDWDLAVLVTELPLRLSRRPLLSHASRTHGVALISLPAVGVLQRRRRLRDAVVDAVGTLLGDPPHERASRSLARRLRVQRRLRELAEEIDDEHTNLHSAAFVARVIAGNILLLLGMIVANRPWRLVGHLSRALLGALAAAAFALVTSDVWRIADRLSPLRLALLMLASIAAAVTTLIVAHDLWERAPEPHAREEVVLFNLATLATVVFGVASLYAAVFVTSLAGAALLLDTSVLANGVGHGVNFWEYARLAWLASSLATVGGALGATVETNEAVREAAYAHLPE